MFNENFQKSFLSETPQRISPIGSDMFSNMVKSMQEFVNAGIKTVSCGNGYYRTASTQVVFYWHEKNDTIDIIAELGVKPYCYEVYQVAKNSSDVSAVDLYGVILKDAGVVISDDYMTDKGKGIWLRLLDTGHRVSVYNRINPDDLIPLNRGNIEQYMSERRFRFVLSASPEVDALFRTRKLRTLAGYPK